MSLTYLKNKERDWMMIVVCEEKKIIKKNWYFNEIKLKIYNLI